MRAITFRKSRPGVPATAVYDEGCSIPGPGHGEVRIKLHAASLNPVDGKFGIYEKMIPERGFPEPFVIGVDGAGVVDALGEGVEGWTVGSRVVVHVYLAHGHGTFAEYCIAQAAACVRIPDGIDFNTAAALPCAGWTAYKGLVTKMRINDRDRGSILITGGNGGVGGFAIQVAAALGLSPIIATCSAASSSRVSLLGATHTIDYNCMDIVGAVHGIVPAGVDYFLDAVSSESVASLLTAVAIDGQVACVGGMLHRGGPGDEYFRGLSIHDVSLGPAAYNSGKPEGLAAIGTAFFELISSKHVHGMVEHTVSLEDALPAVLGTDGSGRRGGKTIITIA